MVGCGAGDGGSGEGVCPFVKEGGRLFTFLRWDSCTGKGSKEAGGGMI